MGNERELGRVLRRIRISGELVHLGDLVRLRARPCDRGAGSRTRPAGSRDLDVPAVVLAPHDKLRRIPIDPEGDRHQSWAGGVGKSGQNVKDSYGGIGGNGHDGVGAAREAGLAAVVLVHVPAEGGIAVDNQTSTRICPPPVRFEKRHSTSLPRLSREIASPAPPCSVTKRTMSAIRCESWCI